jgi:hypothetical protein
MFFCDIGNTCPSSVDWVCMELSIHGDVDML